MAGLSAGVECTAAGGVRRKSMDPVSEFIRLQELPNPGNRFSIKELIGIGTSANVYSALDQQKGIKVAVKIITNIAENILEIESEYRAMCSIGGQSILPAFHGAYLNTTRDGKKELWFVMELCEGVTVLNLLKWLDKQNKSLTEEEISAISKSMLIGIHYLHENGIIHRDLRSANFIISANGELKIFDFGSCAVLKGDNLTAHSAIGAPHWMAPEVVVCEQLTAYTKSCDIWSFGITAVEIAQKKPPLHDVHPVRALFFIARNPPTTLHKSEEYSDVFKDFIDECLVKNPDHRPCAAELLSHPFITQLDDVKAEIPSQELLSNQVPSLVSAKGQKILNGVGQFVLECISDFEKLEQPYMTFKNWHFKTGSDAPFIRALPDDVACVDQITEDNVLDLLYQRHQKSEVFTFIGDILIFISSNKSLPLFGPEIESQYCEKARSDNAPNIFAVADRAYQQMLHHKKPQVVITVGETKSLLTSEVIKHLAFLGPINKNGGGPKHLYEITHTLKKSFDITERIRCICPLLDNFGNAMHPTNIEVCRYIKYVTVTFTKTGKVSGAIVNAELLESFSFTTQFLKDYNFYVFYYMHHGLKSENKLSNFGLENLQSFRYLPKKKTLEGDKEDGYKKLMKVFETFNLKEEEISSIFHILSAILLLGEVEYKVKGKVIEPANSKIMEAVARNLGVNKVKLQGLFTKVKDVKAAQQLIDSFAILLYETLFKWIVSALNQSLSFSRLVLGDVFSVSVTDFSNLQDHSDDGYFALRTNILNDLLLINIQKLIFVNEMQEYEQEKLDVPFKYEECAIQSNELNDHEMKLTQLLANLQSSISEKQNRWTKQLESNIKSSCVVVEKNYIKVNHVSKKVQYRKDAVLPMLEVLNINDIISVLKTSTSSIVAGLIVEFQKGQKRDIKCMLPNLEEHDFPHVVVCISPDDGSNAANEFVKEKVLQQIQSYHLVETAIIRKQGYARRLPFLDFLNRYKYLAFDFDENVDVTADNCRLLLIRLKMDGWIIGSKKVFLKYYAEEYLSRLYETHVKKIVKVQAMARRFIVKVRQSKKA